MDEPTREMRVEAERAGTWRSRTFNADREYPRIQLITIAEAFTGRRVEFPGENRTLKSSPPAAPPKRVNLTLPGILDAGTAPVAKRRATRGSLNLPDGSAAKDPAPAPPPVSPRPGIAAAKPRSVKGMAKTRERPGEVIAEEQRAPSARRRLS
jgi:hypothetical protein